MSPARIIATPERRIYLGEAIAEHIRASELPFEPRQFEFWFAYRSGRNAALNAAADAITLQNGALTGPDIDRLHDSYLSPWRMGEGAAVTASEEVGNSATADHAVSVEDQDNEENAGAGETVIARTEGNGASAPGANPDLWQTMLQVGAQFVGALAAANDPKAPAHPWIERDPDTGASNLKIPLPPPETARQLADALSAFANNLRGHHS